MRKLFENGGLMRMFRADENAMPLPPASLGWFHQHQHLAAEQVSGQSTEHPFYEEAGLFLKDLKNPFVVECLHKQQRQQRYSPETRLTKQKRTPTVPSKTGNQDDLSLGTTRCYTPTSVPVFRSDNVMASAANHKFAEAP